MAASASTAPCQTAARRQELQRVYSQKCTEAAKLLSKLDEAQRDVQSLCHALGRACNHDCNHDSVIPRRFSAGERPSDAIRPLKDLLEWLAERVDVSSEAAFAVDAEVSLGDGKAFLGRMVTWPLSRSGGQKLSVPRELREDVANLLVRVHAAGHVSPLEAEDFAEQWDMVNAKVSSEGSPAVPAIFLLNPSTAQTIVVAAWPKLSSEPGSRSRPLFDPARHFTRSLLANQLLSLPRSKERPPSEDIGVAAVQDKAAGARHRSCIALWDGDRVEVWWGGQWYTGVLRNVKDGMAQVQCDTDMPGLITFAPVSDVRLTRLVAIPTAQRQS